VFLFHYHVAAPIARFICLKVGNLIKVPIGIGSVARVRSWPMVSVLGMEMVIHMTMEAFRSVEPWPGADENSAGKPFRAIVAIGGTCVWWNIVVSIRTRRRDTDVDAHLSF
jgi:hypothetical protein